MTNIPVEEIEVLEDRQRQAFPEQAMLELQESIFETNHGLLTPILVRPRLESEGSGPPYILVAGERRLRTITKKNAPYTFANETIPAGRIPVIIKSFEDAIGAEEAELHENIYRLNLTWQEKALAISRLHKFKVKHDPKHSLGMTARAIDTEDNADSDYPSTTAYRHTRYALLVEDHLEDEDVKKAQNLTEASRIVARKIEQQALENLSKKRIADIKELETTLDDKPTAPTPDLPDLPDTTPTAIVKNEGLFYQGDCLKILDTFEAQSIDLVIADPPYGVDADKFKNFGTGSTPKHEYKDSEEEALMVYFKVITMLSRVCKEHSHMYFFCDFRHFAQIREFFPNDWKVRNAPLVWTKGNSGVLSEGVGNGWTRTHECIVVAKRGSRSYSRVQGDTISVPGVRGKDHGAEKPVDLYCKLLQMSGLPNDVVLDPFAGSGTIFEACYKMMMKPVGIELDPVAGELCEQRRKG